MPVQYINDVNDLPSQNICYRSRSHWDEQRKTAGWRGVQ